eukprot:38208-Hanusia_phi.AAC.2
MAAARVAVSDVGRREGDERCGSGQGESRRRKERGGQGLVRGNLSERSVVVRYRAVRWVDGMEFVRILNKTRKVSIVYVAPDGSYLRSTKEVLSYLEKAGISRTQAECEAQFVFDADVQNENESTSLKDDQRSASDTPVKETRSRKRNLSLSEANQGNAAKKVPKKEEEEEEEEEEAQPSSSTRRSSRGTSSQNARTSAGGQDAAGVAAAGKRRNREIAESRAAAFARGQG